MFVSGQIRESLTAGHLVDFNPAYLQHSHDNLGFTGLCSPSESLAQVIGLQVREKLQRRLGVAVLERIHNSCITMSCRRFSRTAS